MTDQAADLFESVEVAEAAFAAASGLTWAPRAELKATIRRLAWRSSPVDRSLNLRDAELVSLHGDAAGAASIEVLLVVQVGCVERGGGLQVQASGAAAGYGAVIRIGDVPVANRLDHRLLDARLEVIGPLDRVDLDADLNFDARAHGAAA